MNFHKLVFFATFTCIAIVIIILPFTVSKKVKVKWISNLVILSLLLLIMTGMAVLRMVYNDFTSWEYGLLFFNILVNTGLRFETILSMDEEMKNLKKKEITDGKQEVFHDE